MNDQDNAIASPLAKFFVAWSFVGISSWSDFAAMCAALWTILLITEWFYVKVWRGFVRPLMVARGYLAAVAPISSHATDDPIND